MDNFHVDDDGKFWALQRPWRCVLKARKLISNTSYVRSYVSTQVWLRTMSLRETGKSTVHIIISISHPLKSRKIEVEETASNQLGSDLDLSFWHGDHFQHRLHLFFVQTLDFGLFQQLPKIQAIMKRKAYSVICTWWIQWWHSWRWPFPSNFWVRSQRGNRQTDRASA